MRKKLVFKSLYVLIYRGPSKSNMKPLLYTNANRQQRSCRNSVKAQVKSLSHVRLFVTPSTVAYQAPPSMGFSRQEYWSGVPLLEGWKRTPGILVKRVIFSILKIKV